MPPRRLPIQMAFDTKMLLPRIRHFERKRDIFFVRGQGKVCERIGKRETPYSLRPGRTVFHAN